MTPDELQAFLHDHHLPDTRPLRRDISLDREDIRQVNVYHPTMEHISLHFVFWDSASPATAIVVLHDNTYGHLQLIPLGHLSQWNVSEDNNAILSNMGKLLGMDQDIVAWMQPTAEHVDVSFRHINHKERSCQRPLIGWTCIMQDIIYFYSQQGTPVNAKDVYQVLQEQERHRPSLLQRQSAQDKDLSQQLWQPRP